MTDTVLDVAGHLAYVALFAGQMIVARGHRAGFAARVLGGVMWLAIGVALGYTSIIFWSGVIASADAYGWWRWRKNL